MKATQWYKGASWPNLFYGLETASEAWIDSDMVDSLGALGVRTHKIVALILLKALTSETNIADLPTLEEEGAEAPSGENAPVLVVRALGTNFRIQHLTAEFGTPDERRSAVDRAIEVVSREQKSDALLTPSGYCEWFVHTLGHMVGLMHAGGYVHKNLAYDNIALDCRLLDTASVRRSTFAVDIARDLSNKRVGARSAADVFVTNMIELYPLELSRDQYLAMFDEMYEKALAGYQREVPEEEPEEYS